MTHRNVTTCHHLLPHLTLAMVLFFGLLLLATAPLAVAASAGGVLEASITRNTGCTALKNSCVIGEPVVYEVKVWRTGGASVTGYPFAATIAGDGFALEGITVSKNGNADFSTMSSRSEGTAYHYYLQLPPNGSASAHYVAFQVTGKPRAVEDFVLQVVLQHDDGSLKVAKSGISQTWPLIGLIIQDDKHRIACGASSIELKTVNNRQHHLVNDFTCPLALSAQRSAQEGDFLFQREGTNRFCEMNSLVGDRHTLTLTAKGTCIDPNSAQAVSLLTRDRDGDGIPDAYDRDPFALLVQPEGEINCGENGLFSETVNLVGKNYGFGHSGALASCQASRQLVTKDINIYSDYGYDVFYRAPTVRLLPGFRAESGSRVTIQAGAPGSTAPRTSRSTAPQQVETRTHSEQKSAVGEVVILSFEQLPDPLRKTLMQYPEAQLGLLLGDSAGEWVLLSTDAPLHFLDQNGLFDIYHYSSERGISLISWGADGYPADGHSTQPVATLDGEQILFRSEASNLIAGNSDPGPAVYHHNLRQGRTARLLGEWPDRTLDAGRPAVAANATLALFERSGEQRGGEIYGWDLNWPHLGPFVAGPFAEGAHAYAPAVSSDGGYIAYLEGDEGLRAACLVRLADAALERSVALDCPALDLAAEQLYLHFAPDARTLHLGQWLRDAQGRVLLEGLQSYQNLLMLQEVE